MSTSDTAPATPAAPRWRPISAIDRRVLGVLVEKAKTTADAYPMSVNAITSAANQKNNRFPVMNLQADDVQESLDRLRQLGAVGEVQGGGRVPRFRHYLYDWLGVEKVELAVMAELLLRGQQTEGELRGRAARMEPITDLSALRPILTSLKAKHLVIALTPEGRGHVVTHALYEPRELERLRAEQGALDNAAAAPSAAGAEYVAPHQPAPHAADSLQPPAAATGSGAGHLRADDAANIRAQVATLVGEVETLRRELAELRAMVEARGEAVAGEHTAPAAR
ncbi:MAG TPA: DUF480 domain-containing protein [Pirellulales bacterium]|jgi:hypothetical protein|nr:DUF480 domain-containing protein [Pirellulales bacterium]